MRLWLADFLAGITRQWPFDKGRWRLALVALQLRGDTAGMKCVKTHHGQWLDVDLSQFLDREIYATGHWEIFETSFIRQWLKPGGSFLDIGANIGYFTTLAASCVGKNGHVVAVEATPATATRLRANLAKNACAHVTVHDVAAGETEASVFIEVRQAGNVGGNALIRPGEDGQKLGYTRVPMQRLDKMLEFRRFDLVKMDVEGAEFKSLKGAHTLIKKGCLPHILFEYSPSLLERLGDHPTDLINFLRSNDYCIFMHDGGAWHSATDEQLSGNSQLNIFASQSATLEDLPVR